MLSSGVLGGRLGYHLLRRIAGAPGDGECCSGGAYAQRNKLEVLLGPDIWTHTEGRTVIDYGCGAGEEAVEIARRGAKRVIGIDIRENLLAEARRAAQMAGVADRCVFDRRTDVTADVIL